LKNILGDVAVDTHTPSQGIRPMRVAVIEISIAR